MKITIIGTGYVGLVSGACFSDFGFDVTCVDIDAGKIERLLRGEIPIYERGLERLVREGRQTGRLHFTTDVESAVARSQVVFLAVGTPMDPQTGHADLRFVEAAAKSVGRAMRGYTVIVNKSTVPVGTARAVEEWVREACPACDFDVVSNPEFLREGEAVLDFQKPDRVVVGSASTRAREVMSALYQPLANAGVPILHTGRETAELIKYAGNAFLALKIGFINEIADLCTAAGADVRQVSQGIGLDRRIGAQFLRPGPGYGGSCFPKDTNALARTGRDLGAAQTIVESVIASNAARKRAMADRIAAAAGGVAGKRIAILGLAFKAGTNDMRDSAAIDIVARLRELGAEEIRVHDPKAMEEARDFLPPVTYCESALEACRGADAVAIVTEWPEYGALDPSALARDMAGKVLVDLRNLIDPARAEKAGLRYFGL